jgi:hypothetical protein
MTSQEVELFSVDSARTSNSTQNFNILLQIMRNPPPSYYFFYLGFVTNILYTFPTNIWYASIVFLDIIHRLLFN